MLAFRLGESSGAPVHCDYPVVRDLRPLAGTLRTLVVVKNQARSTMFCNSRTFPGHGYDLNSAIASWGVLSMRLFIRAA